MYRLNGISYYAPINRPVQVVARVAADAGNSLANFKLADVANDRGDDFCVGWFLSFLGTATADGTRLRSNGASTTGSEGPTREEMWCAPVVAYNSGTKVITLGLVWHYLRKPSFYDIAPSRTPVANRIVCINNLNPNTWQGPPGTPIPTPWTVVGPWPGLFP